jgi:dipeptidyl aminopeptidase/acylaminoacyl peptidase
MTTVASHGRVVLNVLELATMAPTLVYGTDSVDVDQVVWVNNDRLAFTMADLETPNGQQDAAPGLFAVNADSKSFKQLVERTSAWSKTGTGGASLEPWNTYLLDGNSLRKGDEVLVVRPESFEDKDVGYIKLLKLNTRTGRAEEVDGPLHSVGWWPDSQGELRAALTRDKEKAALRWKDPSSGQWRVLSEFNIYTDDANMQVRHVGPDGKLYVTARRGNDKQAMWLLDPTNGKWSDAPLAQSPLFDVDAQVVARQDKVLGLRFTIDAEVTQWLDADLQGLQKQMDKVLPRTTNRLSVPWQGDSPWVLIEAFSDVQPTQFILFNRVTKQFSRLGAVRPDIDARQMATMRLERIKARDGTEVPVWVTLPPGVASPKNLPMVVLVHGGPWVHGPSWHWNAEVQFLAARGYVVLQPQFRGTRGFGDALFKASWKQWGKAMQTDVADATRWAIAQGIADPKRVAIAGASYGGYATLMGLVRDPDLFRCGVAWVGVTDLDMLYSVNWSDFSDNFKKFGMPAMLGDRVKDAVDLKENSPLTHAAKITQPLLLAYGEKDQRVPLVHGEKFRKAVQPVNRALEWVEYKDEGHGWRDPANQVDFYNRMAKFLDQHLAP